MSRNFIKDPSAGAICSNCEGDLEVRGSMGHVYCSERGCKYWRRPHPMGKTLNVPKRLEGKG